MDDTILQILAEHYKDSYEILQTKIKLRDRSFFFVLCVLSVMVFQLYTPQEALNLITQFISNRLNTNTQINLIFIESIIWFILLATTIKYFQSVVFIERQYNYLHNLEESISNEFPGKAFTREGLSYLKNYPMFLWWTSFLYTIFFPIILMLVTVSKVIWDWKTKSNSVPLWFNIITFLFILISNVLYLNVIHSKK